MRTDSSFLMFFAKMIDSNEIWNGEMWDEVCAYCGSAYWEKSA